jgi:hypothetical protein
MKIKPEDNKTKDTADFFYIFGMGVINGFLAAKQKEDKDKHIKD